MHALLTNGLHSTYLRDQMPLDHWFHAFQVTFGDMVVAGPAFVTQALTESTDHSRGYDYPSAMTHYVECHVRPLDRPTRGPQAASP